MKVKDFLDKLKYIEKNIKTIYVYGTYGRSLSESLIDFKARQYPKFNTPARTKKYRSLLGQGYFAFDCCGLIKGILWGWDGKTEVGYSKNGVPDVGANTMIARSEEVKSNFNDLIQPGEVVWMPGHIGVFIGAGEVIEATPRWSDGVQITRLQGRGWQKHGKLPWIDYTADIPILDGYLTHTVRKRDTPWGLAAKYLGDGRRYPEIMKYNKLNIDATIFVGQELKIPTEGYIVHRVIKGDTPWVLAAEYLGDGTRYPEIMRLNNLQASATIYVGQELRIPKKGGYIIHVVRKGDTPWDLATRYLGSGTRYPEIMRLNNLQASATIYVGQELKIPTR